MKDLLLAGPVVALALLASGCVGPGTITPDLNCTKDSDCVLAARLDVCCDCPEIYSRKQVDGDSRLILYLKNGSSPYPVPARDYPYSIRRIGAVNCEGYVCKTCAEPPSGLVCSNNVCSAA